MALRIARGLFRLWLVLSVLVTWQNLPKDEYVVLSELGDFAELIPKRGEGGEVPFDPSKPYTVVRDKERWEVVRLASIIALAPPPFISALGTALGWAFRGFR